MLPVVLVRARRLGGTQVPPQVVRVVSRLFGSDTTNWGLLGLLRPPLAVVFGLPLGGCRALRLSGPPGTKCAWRILLKNPAMSAMLPLWMYPSEVCHTNALPAH